MKVIKSEENILEFDNGLRVIGDGDEDCCAYNYLDFEQLPVGTELPTMTGEEFAKNITLKEDGFYSNITNLFLKYKDSKIELGQLKGEIKD